MPTIKSYSDPRRSGKSILIEQVLKFKILGILNYDVPAKPFVLWIPRKGSFEEVVWLPTGEVTSRRV